VVQEAVKLILEPIFEADFQSGSHGYRPKRTAHQAVSRVAQAMVEEKTRVIDLDLRAYAVPGNTHSLSLFRHRVLVHWWHSIRRRSQKRPISWTRMLVMAKRWLPEPGVLHPYPEARFAATHPR